MRRTVVALLFLICTSPANAEGEWPPRKSFGAGAGGPLGASVQLASADYGTSSRRGGRTAKSRAHPNLLAGLRPSSGPWSWKVTKTAWAPVDEAGFEEFIRQIGESDCSNVHDCLTSPVANPRFHARRPANMAFFADCADLPFALRAYWAWQNGLPFSFPVQIGNHPRTVGHDSRLQGNQTIRRHDIVGPGPDIRLALPALNTSVNTEQFRMPPAYAGKVLNDHYPIRVTRESIKAGTVVFDPDGHIAVVYKVSEDGRIHYIDAHPDNSLTRGIFGRDFARADPPMGAGFKRWRPQTLVGAKPGPDGSLIGGRIILTPDTQLPDWSDEQFFGNQTPRKANWRTGEFAIDGQTVDYHDYIRLRLAFPGFKYDPLDETRVLMRQLCRELGYRVDAVDRAVKAGFPRKPQPDRLPRNIYATSGDWEIYSTPSRDARIKTTFEELRDELARYLELEKAGSRLLNYTGTDLRKDLIAAHEEEAAACSITYTRSDGTPKKLGYEEVKRRLFAMSFDPYHCVERRWGASDPEELATCADDKHKTAWYVAEARLRNQVVRTYGEPMGWGLAELQNDKLDIGIKEPPDVDAMRTLQGLRTASTPTDNPATRSRETRRR